MRTAARLAQLIFLFGFSRGAFTVRVLAGLIFRCGLLRPNHPHFQPPSIARTICTRLIAKT